MALKDILTKAFDGQALTQDQFEKALEKQNAKLFDLNDGEFIAKDKYDRKVNELKDTQKETQEALQKQLDDANKQIKAFNDMDIDGIKQATKDWEEKYNTDTQALKDQMAAREKEYAARDYLGQYQFTSDLAKKAALSEFLAQDFKYDGGKFLGADDYMKQMQETQPGAFVKEQTKQDGPQAASGPTMTEDTEGVNKGGGFNFHFTGVRKTR